MQSLEQQVSAFRTFRSFAKCDLPLDDAAEACADEDKANRAKWLLVRAALARGTRLSLAMKESNLWPDMAIRAITAAEKSNRLDGVFEVLMLIATQKRNVNGMLKKKLIGPVIYILLAIGLIFSSVLVIFPVMTKSVKKREGIIEMLDALHALMQVALIPTVIALIALAVWLLISFQTEPGRNLLARLLDRVPGWGQGMREIALCYWCSMIKLLDAAGDMHDEDAIELAASTIPDVHAEAFHLLLRDYRSMGSLLRASSRTQWTAVDPRRRWPILFAAGLYSAAKTGRLGDSMLGMSTELMESGSTKVERSIGTIQTAGTMLTMFGIAMIMGIYSLSQLSQVLSSY